MFDFLKIEDVLGGDVSTSLILVLFLAVLMLAGNLLFGDASRPKKYSHALDTMRLSWLEEYDATLVRNPENGLWAVIVHGKPVGIGMSTRVAIDKGREVFS